MFTKLTQLQIEFWCGMYRETGCLLKTLHVNLLHRFRMPKKTLHVRLHFLAQTFRRFCTLHVRFFFKYRNVPPRRFLGKLLTKRFMHGQLFTSVHQCEASANSPLGFSRLFHDHSFGGWLFGGFATSRSSGNSGCGFGGRFCTCRPCCGFGFILPNLP